jgi:hypothetical protein
MEQIQSVNNRNKVLALALAHLIERHSIPCPGDLVYWTAGCGCKMCAAVEETKAYPRKGIVVKLTNVHIKQHCGAGASRAHKDILRRVVTIDQNPGMQMSFDNSRWIRGKARGWYWNITPLPAASKAVPVKKVALPKK